MKRTIETPEQLLEDSCSLLLPVADAMPEGLEVLFQTGDTNDVAFLLPQALTVMLRGLALIQQPLVLIAYEMEEGSDTHN